MGLGHLVLHGAGSPCPLWNWVPSINGSGSPFPVWGWIPFYCMRLGPLAIDWLEDRLQIRGSPERPSAFDGAQHLWHSLNANPDLRGCVPFYCVGLRPLSSNGAESLSTLSCWVLFQSVGVGPLFLCGAGLRLFSGAGTLWD